ncbi:LysR family transcriptional regulator [Hyalangium rubrum]|uniref:LysR family transcriptional regulator n=1 Tax=Hyalangium rubrum TaxID=3103134 RepID=A0ABU5HG07_9BACT|nr:LysR family transcriptional regulator [Hyalangium sp. s54d21]MDY7231748.1 LysR family transcriptional regulator [Hyalangium sp. s54d21]
MNEKDRVGSVPVDLNLFRVFEAVFRSGGITQAATQLHLTQPAVSNALARLRAHFDDPLFVREGRRVVPTPLARSMSEDVTTALRTLQDSVRRGQHFSPATSTRRFTLGMRDVLEFALLPPLVHDLQQLAPHLGVQSAKIERRRLARQLASGELDLAVDVPMTVGEDVHQQVLFQEELCVAMRPGHPLAGRRLTVERWLSARHVVVSARASGPVLEDLAIQHAGVRRDIAVRCQHYYAASHLVATSDHLLTLPRYYGEWFRKHLMLHLVPVPLPMPALEVTLYWHRNTDGDPGHEWLRERLLLVAGRSGAMRKRASAPRARRGR